MFNEVFLRNEQRQPFLQLFESLHQISNACPSLYSSAFIMQEAQQLFSPGLPYSLSVEGLCLPFTRKEDPEHQYVVEKWHKPRMLFAKVTKLLVWFSYTHWYLVWSTQIYFYLRTYFALYS